MVERIKKWFRKIGRLRPQKMHLDYLAGMLSIPVLILAIFINWSNLIHQNAPTKPGVSPSPQVIVVPQKTTQTIIPTNSPVCTKSIGPISIASPTEGQTVSDNPVCITISYPDATYCSVVWSYRINGGTWSDYTTNSPCLYNLPNGKIQFDLRVTSTVSSDSTSLSRSFTYTGTNAVPSPTPTPTTAPSPTPVASSSAQ